MDAQPSTNYILILAWWHDVPKACETLCFRLSGFILQIKPITRYYAGSISVWDFQMFFSVQTCITNSVCLRIVDSTLNVFWYFVSLNLSSSSYYFFVSQGLFLNSLLTWRKHYLKTDNIKQMFRQGWLSNIISKESWCMWTYVLLREERKNVSIFNIVLIISGLFFSQLNFFQGHFMKGGQLETARL